VHNSKHHDCTKHIDIQHYFIQEAIEGKLIQLVKTPTQEQLADILTKPLSKGLFEKHHYGIGIRPASQATVE
jgi:hypothetical protein